MNQWSGFVLALVLLGLAGTFTAANHTPSKAPTLLVRPGFHGAILSRRKRVTQVSLTDDPASPNVLPVASFTPTTPTEGAVVTHAPGQIVTQLPTSDCLTVVTTPLIIDEYAVFATHKRSPKPDQPGGPNSGCDSDPTQPGLYAISTRTGEAFTLAGGVSIEGTPTYAEEQLIVPLVGGGGGLLWWQGSQFHLTNPLRAGSDSAGLWDPARGSYIVGSVNNPLPVCQNGPNPDCGALIATDSGGTILARLDRTNGLRGWVTGGPTTDGDVYFMGNGSGLDGETTPENNALHECSALKISRDFQILANYDDGDVGCRRIGHLESAVVGEMPVVGDVLWAQYLGSTDGTPFAPVVQLRAADLTPVCRALLPALPNRGAAGFYQAPVVDADGNAYVIANDPQNGMNETLYKIDPHCAVSALFQTDSTAASTPTLADDRCVLLAAAGVLHVINRQSGAARDYPLGSTAPVIGGAVIGPYGVTVVGEDGTVTTRTDTGLEGYGNDPWPRFRKDNFGGAGGMSVSSSHREPLGH